MGNSLLLLTHKIPVSRHEQYFKRLYKKNNMNMTITAAHCKKLWHNKNMMHAFISRHFIYYPTSKQKRVQFLNPLKMFLHSRGLSLWKSPAFETHLFCFVLKDNGDHPFTLIPQRVLFQGVPGFDRSSGSFKISVHEVINAQSSLLTLC